LILVNKDGTGPVPTTVEVSSFTEDGSAQLYQFSKAMPKLHSGDMVTISSGHFVTSLPAWSATLAVISPP